MAKGGPPPTTSTTVQLSPEQQQMYGMALPYLKDFAGQAPQRYQGSTVADFNPLEPLHVGNSVPAGNNQAQRSPVAFRDRLAVSLVGQNQIRALSILERHAAAEGHFDGQLAWRSFAERFALAIDAEKHDFESA